MVSPHPDLKRKIDNTSNIVSANKTEHIPGLHSKYPDDYIDLSTHEHLTRSKTWMDKKNKYGFLSENNLKKNKSNIENLSVTGGDKILIFCVDFSDKISQIPVSSIQNRFFATTGNSFRNYFIENSYSLFLPEGSIIGNKWYRLPQTMGYYVGTDNGTGTYPQNSQRLFEDLLSIINNDPNITSTTLSNLDIDGDNRLNRVIIVHSGAEAATTGNSKDLWAHAWGLDNPITIKGKTFQDYSISAEYLTAPNNPQVSGVDCHEFLHTLGLPDLYDYNDYTNGLGYWSSMSSGSWGNNGQTPVHADIWSKSQLGWIIPQVDINGNVTLRNAENYPDGLKITTSDPKQYFLIECRQKTLFDMYLPGTGLLIYRVNEGVDQYTSATCHTVSLIQADNFKDLENKINLGDAGDSYPGTKNVRAWSKNTSPDNSICNGTKITKGIDQIPNSSNSMTFRSNMSVVTCTTPLCTFNIL